MEEIRVNRKVADISGVSLKKNCDGSVAKLIIWRKQDYFFFLPYEEEFFQEKAKSKGHNSFKNNSTGFPLQYAHLHIVIFLFVQMKGGTFL